MDQQRLALAGPAAFKHIVPDGEQRFGQRRGLVQRQASRHRQAVVGRRQAIFGIAAARDQRADLLRPASHDLTPSPSATTVPAISSPGIGEAPGGGG